MKIKVADIKSYNINQMEASIVLVYEDKNVETVEDINSYKIKSTFGTIEHLRYIYNGEKNIIVAGLGDSKTLTTTKVRTIGADICRKLNSLGFEDVVVVNLENLEFNSEHIQAFVEGLMLGNYKFDKYKTKSTENSIKNINILLDNPTNKKDIKEGCLLGECNIIARNLTNEPANFLTPTKLSIEVEKLGVEYGFETEIYSKESVEELKMDSFLAVSKGSNQDPKLIVMKYMGDTASDEILGLVGKGITYDSGGFSLKSTESMVNMSNDMGGASAVIGAMCAIAKSKPNKNVVAVVAACENIISSKAYKPGDIISSMAGKTIEVVNTDCEGRLTLADAVYYTVEKEKATKVVTIATLTGAAVTALGKLVTPVITNSDRFYNELEKSSKYSDEKVWQLPSFEEYKRDIIGNIADLKNATGKHGGCITAALFIGEFVKEKPWIHMDIAGTVDYKETEGYKTKGASGEGAKTLYYLAQ